MPKQVEDLRHWLVWLLRGGDAHAKFDDVVKDFPAGMRGRKPPNAPYGAWQLLEHMRIAQADILEFCVNPRYQAREWPGDYWPKSAEPPEATAWDKSVQAFRADLSRMAKLIEDPGTDLYARIPWGDGQTILREALLVADHNAYHLGALMLLRRLLRA